MCVVVIVFLIVTCICSDYTLVYINKQNSEKVKLEFEIRIQFCTMCLNLCGDYIIIMRVICPFKFFNLCVK